MCLHFVTNFTLNSCNLSVFYFFLLFSFLLLLYRHLIWFLWFSGACVAVVSVLLHLPILLSLLISVSDSQSAASTRSKHTKRTLLFYLSASLPKHCWSVITRHCWSLVSSISPPSFTYHQHMCHSLSCFQTTLKCKLVSIQRSFALVVNF